MHKIDLKNSNMRLDLINDKKKKKIDELKEFDSIKVEKIFLNSKRAKTVNKNEGEYISILFDDITDSSSKDKLFLCFHKELQSFLKRKKLLKKPVLIIGLGNEYATPDSLGPKVIKNIITTRHIYLSKKLDKNYSIVSKLAPGVFANTGIETFDIVKSLVNTIKPKYLIVIDALSSKSLDKVNKVIQITDSGIDPGSGVGNNRKEISKNTLGIDVISIGVPTVVNLHTIIKDTLNEYELDNVLKDKPNNYLVTPNEIDFVIENISFIISKAINNALHNLTK